MDHYTELVDSQIFKLNRMPLQVINGPPHMLMLLSFEMDLDMDVINRVGYNVIDMFSDIGGIQSIIMTTFALILTVLNYNYFDSYMAQKLYKLEKE